MFGGRVLVGLACIAGCVREPEFRGQGAPGVVAETSGNGAVVAGPFYRMAFNADAGARIRMPDLLEIAGTDVIGHDPGNCSLEDEIGLAHFPGPPLTANSQLAPTLSTVHLTFTGPAVAQAVVNVEAELQCNAPSPGSRRVATSTFTFFPDGKLVREDVFRAEGAAQTRPCVCAGGGTGDQFIVTSFYTFAGSQFDNQVSLDDQAPVTLANNLDNYRRACIAGPGREIAVAWQGTTTRIMTPNGNIAYVWDFGNIAGNFDESEVSALFLGDTGDCAAAMRRAQVHLDAPALDVNGTSIGPLPRSGIYGAFDAGVPVLNTSTARIRPAAGAIDVGFTIWLDFDREIATPTITRDPPLPEPWFAYQRQAPDQVLLWFPDGLAEGQTITVTAP